MLKGQEKGSSQAQASGPSSDALKMNHLYVIHSMTDQEKSPNVVTSMLQVLSINVFYLLEPCSTSYFVTL